MNKGLTSALGALTGVVAVLAMIRLVAGAGFTSVLAWGFLLAAMLPWIGYCGWRARRGALRPRGALAVLGLSLVGLCCVWLFTLGPVVALICSLAGFVVIWVHDWPKARARGETQYVRVDDLTAGEAEPDHSIDTSRTAA